EPVQPPRDEVEPRDGRSRFLPVRDCRSTRREALARRARNDQCSPPGKECGPMRVAWFTHRYYPCIGGAENYGRAMVRRRVGAGHSVDVFTSNAHDLWFFKDPRRRSVDAPAVSLVDGARVERLPIRHYRYQRYVGRLLSYVPYWPIQCCFESYMPIIPRLG